MPVKQRKVPLRQCKGCNTMRPKKELVRVVRTPEGDVLVDDTGKKAGRGAYLCPASECLQAAFKSKRLERELEVTLTPEVVATLQAKIQPTL